MKKASVIDVFNKVYSMANVVKLVDIKKSDDLTISKDTIELNGKIYDKPFNFLKDVRFGWKDKDIDPKIPVNKRPSWTAAKNFVADLPDIKELFLKERYGEDRGWIAELDLQENGDIINTVDNLTAIIEHDKNLHGIAFNQLTSRKVYKAGFLGFKTDGVWEDDTDSRLYTYLEREYKFTKPSAIAHATTMAFKDNAFHPIQEYIKDLKWDGVERLERLFVDYIGAEDTKYVRTVTRRKFIASVARAMRPGCKHDEVLVLSTANQGLRKSTIIRKLAKDNPQWYNEHLGDLKKRDTVMEIQKWLIEESEMQSMRKAEAEDLKSFVSRVTDTIKLPYAHNVVDLPRTCSFFGTTNSITDIITDPSGGRRFWIVEGDHQKPTKGVFEDLDDEVDQIWAEAMHYYMQGEQWWLTPEEEEMAREVQAYYTQELPFQGQLMDYLDRKLPEHWYEMPRQQKINYLNVNRMEDINCTVVRREVCAREIFDECINQDGNLKWGNPQSAEISKMMSYVAKGWRKSKKTKRFGEYGMCRFWERAGRGERP